MSSWAKERISISELWSPEQLRLLIQDTSRIPEGERTFERLIDEMVVSSKQIKDYPPGIIGEQTLQGALGRLCPLFPIC